MTTSTTIPTTYATAAVPLQVIRPAAAQPGWAALGHERRSGYPHAAADAVEVLDDDESGRAELHYRPLGVVGAIGPWNWLMMIGVWQIASSLRMANGLKVGLGSFVWSSDETKAREVEARLQAGTTWINKHGTVDPGHPSAGPRCPATAWSSASRASISSATPTSSAGADSCPHDGTARRGCRTPVRYPRRGQDGSTGPVNLTGHAWSVLESLSGA